MTVVPAIIAPDSASLPAFRPAGSLPGDAFPDILGSVGEALAPTGESNTDGESTVAAAQGAIVALAAMLASVAAMKDGHKPAVPDKSGDAGEEEEPSGPGATPGKAQKSKGTASAATLVMGELTAAAPNQAASRAQSDAPGPVTAPVQPSPVRSAAATTAVMGQAAQAWSAHAVRSDLPVDADRNRGAAKPGPLASEPVQDRASSPATSLAAGRAASPTDPVLAAVPSLVRPDERPAAANEPRVANVEPMALVSAAPPFLHSPAAAQDMAGARQEAPPIDQSIGHHLDLAREGEWLDQLAGDIARSAGRSGTLRFRLHPEALGRLHVEVSQGAGGASIRLTTENETAQGIIAEAQPRLIAEARAQGVRIAETHVALSAGGQWSSTDHHGQRQAADAFLRTSGPGSSGAGGEEPPASYSAGPEERYA